jgi:hypothetical protein
VKTVHELVDAVHEAATAEGMDLSPSDVGHLLSLFFEGLMHNQPGPVEVDTFLQNIADECASVRDE